MPDNFNRRLSASSQTRPGHVERPSPREVSGYTTFDRRYLAWRIRNPDHPLANDPDYLNTGRWPRQQANESCNFLQLYEHIEHYALRSQTEYVHYNGNSRVLMMPHQEITPKTGWKLFDHDDQLVYTVKEALVSRDFRNKSTFDGRILLAESSGPPEGHHLEWIDPYGEADEEVKVIKLVHQEDVRPLLRERESTGDVAEVKGLPFYPIIGYAMVRREPASVSNHPFGPAREISHRVRMVVRDPDNPDITQKIWGQWWDCIVEFKVYALGPKIADRISVWLEQFLMRYNQELMLLGVQKMLPWSMRRDREEARVVHDLSVRTVEFYFRLEDIQVELNSQIKSFDMQIQVDKGERIPWFTSEPDLEIFPTDTSGTLPAYGGPDIGDDY